MKIIRELIIKTESEFNNYVEQVVEILTVVLNDPYQGVRKEGCGIVVLLAKWNAKSLGFFGDTVVKALLPCLGHRHSAVRVMGLEVRVLIFIIGVKICNDCEFRRIRFKYIAIMEFNL